LPSSHFHSLSSFFLFLLLNTIIFVFSTFTSSFFFLTYFSRFLIISFISLSLFATITISSANARLHTFSLPTTTPTACAFFNISSTSATYIVNSRGLSGQPCLTPFVVSNHSPSFSPTFTLFLVLAYISSTFRTSHSLIPLSLIHSNIFTLSTLSNAALKSMNNAYILPPFFLNSFLAKWSRMYTLSTVPLPFLNPA
jgi:hypothetical protein